ncbi:MAG: B12-binding domain-containing radical SAM protein [Deltaproteobacteria bacterium]|nr:B12-binding domain-containing radical SAM protein [Deltaproteobacteria bacterium]MBW1993515.1 B12-binding domain-containing radical SAM protein [Deltaproteobacteria bacterium]MBW2151945.1 B12-binding domain-containing radical SAM protein [Deltaproteobacteria bacterium]
MKAGKILIIIPYEDVDRKLNVLRKVIYPLEPAIVVSILREHGFLVEGVDLNLNFQNEDQILTLLQKTILRSNSDIVLIMSQHLTFLIKDQYEILTKIIASIRRISAALPIILAGTTPSLYPEKFFKQRFQPDILFRGEIENRIIPIINSLEDTNMLKTIKGVCIRDKGRIHISGESNFVEDINSLPIADRQIFPLDQYFKHPETGNLRYPEKSRKFTQIAATRGCNTGCSFCKVKYLRARYRRRELNHIIEEIKFLINKKGIEEIHFLDENLLLNKPKAVKLFQRIIDEPIKFHWFCGGGMAVYMLDRDILKLMKLSGCYRLHLAIESGSQRILDKIMKKPIKLTEVLQLLNYAKELDFEIIGYFMIGLPTETRAEVLKTVALAKNKAFDYVVFSIYTPEKNTELYNYCINNNLLDNDKPLYRLSKRAASNLRFKDYDEKFLISIRNDVWKQINFAEPKRKEKIKRMFGGIADG